MDLVIDGNGGGGEAEVDVRGGGGGGGDDVSFPVPTEEIANRKMGEVAFGFSEFGVEAIHYFGERFVTPIAPS